MEDRKVVVACLPQVKHGQTSAASVAKNMLRSFPAIHFRLMLGIAGECQNWRDDTGGKPGCVTVLEASPRTMAAVVDE